MIKQLFNINELVGITIGINNQLISTVSFCHLKRDKEEIALIKHGTCNELAELPGLVDLNIPIVLNLTGAPVLTKVLSQKGEMSPLDIVDGILPNANQTDYYVQSNPQVTNIASIIRKTAVEDVLGQLLQLEAKVVQITLEAISLIHLLELLPKGTSSVHIGNKKIELEEGGIIQVSYAEEEVQNFTIDNASMNSMELASYACAYQFFLPTAIQVKANSNLESAKDEYIHQKVFKYGKITAALLLVLFAAVNLFSSSILQKKNNELLAMKQKNAVVISELKHLSQDLQDKEAFLEEVQWSNASQTSYYADQLAKTIDPEISLTALTLFPKLKLNHKKEESPQFNNSIIKVFGESLDAMVVNNWKNELVKLDWVQEVKLIDYSQNKEKEQIKFELELVMI